MLIDSILTLDTINSENIVKAVPQTKKVIRKISKVKWIIIQNIGW